MSALHLQRLQLRWKTFDRYRVGHNILRWAIIKCSPEDLTERDQQPAMLHFIVHTRRRHQILHIRQRVSWSSYRRRLSFFTCFYGFRARDTCGKDSGGGLYWLAGRQYAIGVISYGTYCASKYPSVNTRITSHIGRQILIPEKSRSHQFCLFQAGLKAPSAVSSAA